MRVKFISNNLSLIPVKFHEYFSDDLKAPLIVNKSYVVYALSEYNQSTFFCILDKESSCPMWHPYQFFEIEDKRLSKYWFFNFWYNWENELAPILSFPEWANDEYFQSNLFEGDEEAWAIFRAYEKLMNVEFPDPAIIERAEIGDEKWLICPLCIDAWLNDTQDALVECPKCKTLMNNPRYKNELPSYKTEQAIHDDKMR